MKSSKLRTFLTLAVPALSAAAQEFDLLLKGGPVIDARNDSRLIFMNYRAVPEGVLPGGGKQFTEIIVGNSALGDLVAEAAQDLVERAVT